MDEKAWQRYQYILEQLWQDSEYQFLDAQRLTAQRELGHMMQALTEDQRQTILDYVGICSQQDWRALESACDTP